MTLRTSKSVKIALTTITSLVILLAITTSQARAQQVSDIVITIDSNGIVNVEMSGIVETGLNSFECPVEPILATIEVLVNSEVVPIIYYNNSIIVISNGSGSVKINYVANVTCEDSLISFYYGSAREATLIVPFNILLVPENLFLIDAHVRDNKLVLKFRGPGTISFVVGEVGGPSPTPPPSPLTPPLTYPIGLEVVLYTTVVAVAIGAIMVIMRRRGRGSLATHLDEVDKAIVEKLRRHGGEVFQSLLYRELSLPKTTVWRHVKKLERMGYVAVERVGRDSKVKLLK